MAVDSVGRGGGSSVNDQRIGFMGNPVLAQLTRSQFQFYLGHVIFDRNSIMGGGRGRHDRNGVFFFSLSNSVLLSLLSHEKESRENLIK